MAGDPGQKFPPLVDLIWNDGEGEGKEERQRRMSSRPSRIMTNPKDNDEVAVVIAEHGGMDRTASPRGGGTHSPAEAPRSHGITKIN